MREEVTVFLLGILVLTTKSRKDLVCQVRHQLCANGGSGFSDLEKPICLLRSTRKKLNLPCARLLKKSAEGHVALLLWQFKKLVPTCNLYLSNLLFDPPFGPKF